MAILFHFRWASRACPILFTSILVTAPSAWAALGKDASSVESDRTAMNSGSRVVVARSHAVHELRTPGGTVVREFVSPRGEVFGIAWQGPFAPDLRQLLGEYFDTYVRASEGAPRAGRRGRHVEAGDLVVEAGGHMRFSQGRAYLRSKLPEGVSPDAVQ